MPILPVPPAFPVPVLPQVFDTSLSYYELLAKLTQAVNAVTVQVNQNTANIASLTSSVQQIQQSLETLTGTVTNMQTAITEIQGQLDGIPEQVQAVSGALTQEIADREAADLSLAQQIARVSNLLQTAYVSYDDMDNDYLLGDITFQLLTQAEFDALETAGQLVAKRVYFIDTGSNIVIRYHYADGETPVMNAQASGLFNFTFGTAAPNITGTFTPDE